MRNRVHLVCLALIVGVEAVLGCGFTTHNVIAHRAMYHFKEQYPDYNEMISTYPNALLGGAPFPDYLYACGSDHDDGEYAHWAPFQANASNYIRSLPKVGFTLAELLVICADLGAMARLVQPWTEDTKKLVVFMMGVTSHYIADINWRKL